jgi:hypothetical protein
VTFPRSLLLAAVSLVLMVVGAAGPWASISPGLGLLRPITIHGTDHGKDGWIVVGAAAAAIVFLLVVAYTRRRWLALAPLLAGGVAAATAAYDITDINRFGGGNIASSQWGIYLALAGSVGLMLSSVLAIAEIRRPVPVQPAPPPDAPAPTAPV